jgi:hypothetical protein
MAKYIVPPATAEQMLRTIGATQEDREIVERILREIGEYDDPPREGPPEAEAVEDYPLLFAKKYE